MNQIKRNKRPYIIIVIILIAVFCVSTYTVVLTNILSENVLNNELDENSSRTDAMYAGISNFIVREDFTDINDSSDKETDLYQNLQSHLNEIRNMNSTRYFYTAKRNSDGKLIYLVDGLNQDAEDFRNPGDLIEEEMIPYLERALDGEIVYSQDIVDTTWGHIFTACYPIKVNDEIIGVLCIETDMESTYTFIASHKKILYLAACLAGAMIISLISLTFFFIKKYRKNKEENEQILLNNNQKLEDSLIREKEHSEIISALSTIYTTIVEVNVPKKSYEIINGVYISQANTERKGFIKDAIDTFLMKSVSEDMREEMKEFLDFDTLSERLKDLNTIMFEFKNLDGRWFQGRFIVKTRDENGNLIEVLYASRDFTDEKKRELVLKDQLQATAIEAKKANVSKTMFLRRMSHDIRTPLNGIVGMIHIAENYKDDPVKMKDCKEKILHSADYLLDIVNNVLDISKLESGNLELEHKPFNLAEMLMETLPIVEANASEYGIAFTGGKEESHIQHINVIGSELHLNRILMNVASNAIKYNKPGGTVKVYCNELSCDGNIAIYEFICDDTGLGMSEEFQKHAFEPFSQEGKETTTSFSGSGLGLSIVKDIVEMMNGTIELQSKENVGTKITMTIPFEICNEQISKEELTEENSLRVVGKKALLVEDNELNMEIAEWMLQEEGLVIVEATNGKEAVDIFNKSDINSFDYIFMDVMMPVMDGIEATKVIRSLDREDAKTIPIIAMTANAFNEDKDACLKAGMNAHVGKPISASSLKEAISKVTK